MMLVWNIQRHIFNPSRAVIGHSKPLPEIGQISARMRASFFLKARIWHDQCLCCWLKLLRYFFLSNPENLSTFRFMKTETNTLLYVSAETNSTVGTSSNDYPVIAPALEDPTTGILVNILIAILSVFKWIGRLFT